MAKVAAQKRKASPEIRHRLGINVKQFRKARGYTQQQLAELCQLDQNYISKVERATVNVTLANLERASNRAGSHRAGIAEVICRHSVTDKVART